MVAGKVPGKAGDRVADDKAGFKGDSGRDLRVRDWLDACAASNTRVVFVAFGSMVFITRSQVAVLLRGLQRLRDTLGVQAKETGAASPLAVLWALPRLVSPPGALAVLLPARHGEIGVMPEGCGGKGWGQGAQASA